MKALSSSFFAVRFLDLGILQPGLLVISLLVGVVVGVAICIKVVAAVGIVLLWPKGVALTRGRLLDRLFLLRGLRGRIGPDVGIAVHLFWFILSVSKPGKECIIVFGLLWR